MADVYRQLELLQYRPKEPLITPKGEENAVFQLSEEFLPADYATNGVELNNRFGDDAQVKVKLNELKRIPQITNAMQMARDADFSLFLPKHQEWSNEVIKALLDVPENELDEFVSTCAYARSNLNPQLFNYAYSIALLHRPDTRKVPVKSLAELFPEKFINSLIFAQARESAAVIPPDVPRVPIIIPRDFTASDLDEEHRVAYWREDMGINLHHWHWHLIFPFTAPDRSIVDKHRRGEIFFYAHQQIIARFNCERLCNSLKRVKKFNNWREPIPEAYFPKLDSLTASRGWIPRQSDMVWKDVRRPADGVDITIDQMEQWRRNIEDAIATNKVTLPDGSKQTLTTEILANLVESNILSLNRELYGSIHNSGHTLTAYMHDPEHRYLESFSVMGDEATTLRDPFFFRWHSWIDDVFQRHKESTLVPRYTRDELTNPGVQVVSITVESGTGQTNTMNTYWMSSDVDLSRGLDFSDRGPVYARFTHLNHRPFRYVIKVNNTGSARRTTVRLFMAPKFDESNREWILSDQRKMFIEMDRFQIPLSAGENTITRLSTESTLTIPFEQTFRDLSVQGSEPRRDGLEAFNYCGCGWPQHMLVPKGTEGGAVYQLFAMFSNYDLDSVDDPNAGIKLSCVEASSFCGLKDRLYPDRRNMGFPFDKPTNYARTIEEMLTSCMGLQEITIRHRNITEPNPRNPTPGT